MGLAHALEEAVATGGAFGGGDFTDTGVAPRIIRTVADAQEAKRRAIKARDEAQDIVDAETEAVEEYDEIIAALDQWIADNKGK